MTKIVVIRDAEGWLFRSLQDGSQFRVRGNVAKVEARRTVEPELDHAFGRRGWVFFN